MSHTNARIDQRLERTRLLIEDALGQPDQDHALLEQGHVLYEQALAEHQRQRAAYAEQFKARRALMRARMLARTEHSRLRKHARHALRDDLGALHRLGLIEPPQQPLAGWLDQARRLYRGVLADSALQELLASYGISPADLALGQEALNITEAALSTYQQTRSVSQHATSARDTRSSEKPGSVATTMNSRLTLAASSFDLYWSERYSSVRRSAIDSITPWLAEVCLMLTTSPTATSLFLPRVTHCMCAESTCAR